MNSKLENWLLHLMMSKIKHHFQIFVHPNIELRHLKNQQHSHMDPNERVGQEETDHGMFMECKDMYHKGSQLVVQEVNSKF